MKKSFGIEIRSENYYIVLIKQILKNENSLSIIDISKIANISINIVNSVLNKLNQNNEIEVDDCKIKLRNVSIIELINRLKNDKTKDILLKRLMGYTLEQIGKESNLTREQIRQICFKTLNSFDDVIEDRYKVFYEIFNFEKDDFLNLFKVNNIEYNYLKTKYKKGDKPVNFDEISKMGFNCENYLLEKLKEDYILIGDKKIKKKPIDIIKYLVSEIDGYITYSDIDFLYKTFLVDYNLNDNYYINLNSQLNRYYDLNLINCYFKGFKYYKIDKELIDLLYLKLELEKIGIYCEIISGQTSPYERETIINNFITGKTKILLTNPHTLGESVSLHNVCHDAIYFECNYNLVHLLQSKDRIHRLGLPENQYTQYYFLHEYFDDFSLDKNIYDRLLEKEKNMLNSIENNILENVYATEDDVNFILKDIN